MILLTCLIWSFFISACVVRKRSLLFKLFGNSLTLIQWRSTLMVLLEGVRVFRHVQIFFVVAGLNVYVVSPLSLGFKNHSLWTTEPYNSLSLSSKKKTLKTLSQLSLLCLENLNPLSVLFSLHLFLDSN